MELELVELSSKNEIYKTYDIYKSCMFMPTKEKFYKKIDGFLKDNSVKIFVCMSHGEIKGIIVISFTAQFNIEIVAIAVDISAQHQGIGSFMINKLVDDYGLLSLYATTDNDAVGFYRKNHFSITEFSEHYENETVIRYKCELAK